MKYLFVFFLASISSFHTAHAVKGTYASKTHELPQSCKLTFSAEVNGKIFNAICSASFIGNKTFSTAEHCEKYINDHLMLLESKKVKEAPYFECPGVERKIFVKETFPIQDARMTEGFDLALMKVDDELPEIKPLSLPKSKEEVSALLKDPTKCFVNGYGRDNEEKSGTLRAIQVVEWDAKPVGVPGVTTESFKLTKNYAQSGDSGGPMFCYDGDRPVLVGVVHGGRGDENYSIIEKITQGLDWMYFVKDNTSPDMRSFRSFIKMEDKCAAVIECFNKLESAAALSHDLKNILKILTTDLQQMKSGLTQGRGLDLKKIDSTWEAFDSAWENQNCYEVLYPSKK